MITLCTNNYTELLCRIKQDNTYAVKQYLVDPQDVVTLFSKPKLQKTFIWIRVTKTLPCPENINTNNINTDFVIQFMGKEIPDNWFSKANTFREFITIYSPFKEEVIQRMIKSKGFNSIQAQELLLQAKGDFVTLNTLTNLLPITVSIQEIKDLGMNTKNSNFSYNKFISGLYDHKAISLLPKLDYKEAPMVIGYLEKNLPDLEKFYLSIAGYDLIDLYIFIHWCNLVSLGYWGCTNNLPNIHATNWYWSLYD